MMDNPVMAIISERTGEARKAIHYIDGAWLSGNPPIMGPLTNAAWMASVAFDGARAFAGCAPDLDRHAQRCVDSARILGLEPPVAAEEIVALSWEGIDRFAEGAELYIRPMFYAEDGFVTPRPESTRFVLTLFEAPLPDAAGIRVQLSQARRPSPETAPTLAKASCLYPQSARALREARGAGYDNAIMLDMNGNVAEFATANLFMTKDGTVETPVPNGTFLNGITRQRVIALLGEDGTGVHETTLRFEDVFSADEVFATNNYGKVVPIIAIDGRELQPGPVCQRARELYFAWARTQTRPV